MMQRASVYIALVFCFLAIWGLFTVKDNVMTLRAELHEVKKQLQNEEDAIRILKAELAYLGSPQRIQKLAQLHLSLALPKATQMIRDPLAPGYRERKTATSVKTARKNNKWRYKKAPGKYLTMAKGEK